VTLLKGLNLSLPRTESHQSLLGSTGRYNATVGARGGQLEDGADCPCELVITTPWGAAVNLCAILAAHMIQETARHIGHADIIREAIDGTAGQRRAGVR
jgi:hypothetical protein